MSNQTYTVTARYYDKQSRPHTVTFESDLVNRQHHLDQVKGMYPCHPSKEPVILNYKPNSTSSDSSDEKQNQSNNHSDSSPTYSHESSSSTFSSDNNDDDDDGGDGSSILGGIALVAIMGVIYLIIQLFPIVVAGGCGYLGYRGTKKYLPSTLNHRTLWMILTVVITSTVGFNVGLIPHQDMEDSWFLDNPSVEQISE